MPALAPESDILMIMNHFVASIFVVLFLVGANVCAQSGSSGEAGVVQVQERVALTVVPDELMNKEIQLLGDRRIRLAEFAGKPIVLNLFATWCGPCRFESPALAELHKEFSDRGVVVIELSTENPTASREILREWVWEFRLPYKVGWASKEMALTLMQGRESIPQTYVIAPDGRIVKRFIGFSPQNTLEQMRLAVEELLK